MEASAAVKESDDDNSDGGYSSGGESNGEEFVRRGSWLGGVRKN